MTKLEKFNATLEEVVDNLYHLKFPEQEDLGRTFVRFQEHYEGAEFRGKIFTLDEFEKWYIPNSEQGKKTGKFTYYEDWTGYNVPSKTLEPFFQGNFNPLSEHEENILNAFENKRKNKFYLIGTLQDATSADIGHEKAHGLFYLNPEYRTKILEVLGNMNPKDKKIVENFLISLGSYHPEVYDNEIHAYLLDRRCIGKNGVSSPGLKIAGKEIKKIFKKYS